jgi:hypothetical protein
MKIVTKEEFERFVISYPGHLERDIAHFAEPPVVTYNDFSLGMWPRSIVARHTFDASGSMTPSEWAVKEAP